MLFATFNAKRHDRSTIESVSFEFTWNVAKDDIVSLLNTTAQRTVIYTRQTALRTGEAQERLKYAMG